MFIYRQEIVNCYYTTFSEWNLLKRKLSVGIIIIKQFTWETGMFGDLF